MQNKKQFEAEIDGKKLKLEVKRPDNKTIQKGQLVYSRTFKQAVKPDDGKPGAIVRKVLNDVLRSQGLWDDEKEKDFKQTSERLFKNERQIAQGGIKMQRAYELAIEMQRDRWRLRQLNLDRNALDLNTAEAQSENARFNFYVSECTVYADSGKKYFADEEDYLTRPGDDPVANKAAEALGQLVYNLDEDFEAKLPENKFLLKYGYCDKKLRLIRKGDGRFIDYEGRLINEKGQLINEGGELIDIFGNPLTDDGEYKVDFKPFLDDDGNEITETSGALADASVPTEAGDLEPVSV